MRSSVRSSGLIICFLTVFAVWIFIGCGGGGGGDSVFSIPTPTAHITGTVLASSTLPSIRTISTAVLGATSEVGLASALVYLESDKEKYKTVTASDGRFDLSVPYGTHRIVTIITATTGVTYKQRSDVLTLSENTPIVNNRLTVAEANRLVRGILRDQNGNPIPNAPLYLWGELFTTDANGEYTSPSLPNGAVGEIKVKAVGYQETTISTTFNSPIPPYLVTSIPAAGQTNRGPIVTLSASEYLVNPTRSTVITAAVTDPDGDIYTTDWAATIGTIASQSDKLKATWTAPSGTGIATVTCIATDSKGLSGAAYLGLSWGSTSQTGSSTNFSPVVSIVASGTNFIRTSAGVFCAPSAVLQFIANAGDNNSDQLTYAWSANSGIFSVSNQSITNWSAPATITDASISITVSDGKGGIGTASLYVGVGKSVPNVTLISPVNGRTYSGGTQSFSAEVIDSQGNAVLAGGGNIFTWFLDGAIIGSNTKILTYQVSTAGSHTAGFRFQDVTGTITTVSNTFAINGKPTVTILAPLNNSTYSAGLPINFVGTGTDLEDGPLLNSKLTWKRVLVGGGEQVIAIGSSCTIATFPSGNNTISFWGQDSFGEFSASQVVNVVVGVNASPVISITTPTPNQDFAKGAMVLCNGVASDPETGALSGNALTWYDGATKLGNASPLGVNTLSTGPHTIYFTASDPLNAVTTTSVSIYVNTTPTATITSPAAGSIYTPGTLISFAGNASDSEDGNIVVVASQGWYNGAWGTTFLGSGPTLNIASLPAGNLTITYGGLDSRGAVGTASINVIVSTPPNMTFSPATDSVTMIGQVFAVTGSGTEGDAPFTALPASALKWAIDGTASPAYNGSTTFNTVLLTPGPHTITLLGSNSFNVVGSTTKRIYGNATPTVAISSPATSIRIDTNSNLTLTGTPTDAEDVSNNIQVAWWVDLPPAGGAWTQVGASSTRDSGVSYSVATSPANNGTHTYYFVAIDSHGMLASKGVDVLVNYLPLATITVTSAQFATFTGNVPILLASGGTGVSFAVSTLDPDTGGAVNSASISWSLPDGSNVNGAATANGVGPNPGNEGNATVTVNMTDGFNTVQFQKPVKFWNSNFIFTGLTGPAGLDFQGSALYTSASGTTGIIRRMDNPETGTPPTINASDGVAGTGAASFTDLREFCVNQGSTTIYVIDNQGALQFHGWSSLTTSGTGVLSNPGGLTTPIGMTYDGIGLLYITDAGNVFRYSTAGLTVGAKDMTVTTLNGVALTNPLGGIRYYNTTNNVYVCAKNQNMIFKCSAALAWQNTIVATSPLDVAFAEKYIFSLSAGQEVGVYDASGTYLFNFGTGGAATILGSIQANPKKIRACSMPGVTHIYVLENDRIQRFATGNSFE